MHLKSVSYILCLVMINDGVSVVQEVVTITDLVTLFF